MAAEMDKAMPSSVPLCDICTGNIKNKKDEKGTFKIVICTYHLELLETNEEAFNAEVKEIMTDS
jgi:hypothetical protein